MSGPSPPAPSGLRSLLSNLSASHNRLKSFVHNRFRVPLSKPGRVAMGLVYMTIPVVGGYYVMQWAISKSHASIGERGERLPVKTVQGLGNRRIDADGTARVVGAGGFGGGVRLSVSTEEEQRRNRRKLEKYLKKVLKKPKESSGDNETPVDQRT